MTPYACGRFCFVVFRSAMWTPGDDPEIGIELWVSMENALKHAASLRAADRPAIIVIASHRTTVEAMLAAGEVKLEDSP